MVICNNEIKYHTMQVTIYFILNTVFIDNDNQ